MKNFQEKMETAGWNFKAGSVLGWTKESGNIKGKLTRLSVPEKEFILYHAENLTDTEVIAFCGGVEGKVLDRGENQIMVVIYE